ncbi:RNA-directed DNA polymerase, eukaryota, reverse transcriptase zinc-binding domain protein [Tanacetum coccineum]|uniref:RNA-directed DNA polymerase, eukaryota, reverse transcriptase zinc-binding domain protein n=1 Tax=Tanacetum coccineum TaxID=301880 RepID=A0ABQ5FCV1_9ASTR
MPPDTYSVQAPSGGVTIMGDFNEVRYKSDRFGSVFNVQGANVFNSFIANAGLEEVPLGGSTFTWCHKLATKMSKLDRFLIFENLLITCPNITTITLECCLSDHRPILLRESQFDYGLTPFRFFHYWLDMEGFNKIVEDAWSEAPCDDSNAMISMMKKLKYLKLKIREWNKGNMKNMKNVKEKHKRDLEALERTIDKGEGTDEVADAMMEVVKSLQNIDKLQALEMAQKAKVDIRYPNTISLDQQADLELNVSKEELKRAVWDCRTDKSPGLDGFTFGFYRRFWKIIENDVFEDVKQFFTYGDILKGCNSCFIALIPKIPDANLVKDFRPISLIGSLYKIIAKIMVNRLVGVLGDIVNEVQSAFIADRQILDGPFILNEVLQWYKLKKKQSLIFKVDFEKAYDSVRWDFLDEVLRKFGFGDKWCNWIQCCLRSSRGSIIINGSPTEEFQFFKGLKQGDPLSPFLFILIMEILHLSFQRVVDAGMFKGIQLSPSVNLSHMFYADDAVFVGQWCDGNIDTLVHVLECFYRASGLRINMSKSKIMGVLVESDKVKCDASKLGCLILKTPFSYLGTQVGGSMSRIQAWNEVVNKVKAWLSKWKIKALPIGGRLTLLKSVLRSMPIFHMSIFRVLLGVLRMLESIRSHFFNGHELNSKKSTWVKWNNMLAPKEKGGLGVSSLYALNRGLMCKWIRRFYTQNTSLWESVIKAIHGDDGKVGKAVHTGIQSCWMNIVHEINVGGNAFKDLYPRMGGVEQDQYDTLSDQVHDVILVPMSDMWVWSLESSGEYSVASIRKAIDYKRLPEVATKTRWIKYVPIKVNAHAWKVKMDSLPTRFNISRRGIDIESIVCSICSNRVESFSHLFFSCSMVRLLARKIIHWWDVPYEEVNSFEDWITWLYLRLPSKHKMMFEGQKWNKSITEMVPDREGKCNESFPTGKPPALSQKWGLNVQSEETTKSISAIYSS